MWADGTDVMFACHHWPRFGTADVRAFLSMQRDVYRWMHDQTMRLANQGLGPTEIAAQLRLPAEFDQSHVRGYYGTVSHNCRSVYNRYLGWYDGNPANLDPMPPVEAGTKYVEFMGGARPPGRRARATGLPVRIGDVAQRLPDGRQGAPGRQAERRPHPAQCRRPCRWNTSAT